MGIFDKFKKGLAKTAQLLKTDVRDLFKAQGRLVDQDFLDELFETLVKTDMGVDASQEIVDEIGEAFRARVVQMEEVLGRIREKLKSLLAQPAAPIDFAPSGPTVIMVAGVNGCGKTTTIAKLACMFQADGKRVVLGAGDTFRAAAVEQLTIWADRLGAKIVTSDPGADPASVAHQAVAKTLEIGADVCIVDTAGRLQTQQGLMKQLTKIHRVLGKQVPEAPHEVLLVLDATTGQNGISQAMHFTDAVQCTGLILAKLDGTAKGGVVVAIRKQVGLPVKYIGVGEQAEDLALFEPDSFVDALFEDMGATVSSPRRTMPVASMSSTTTLEKLLAAGPVVTDGAWGTQLQARGLPVGACPERWNLEQPDKVQEVAQAYVDAGSQVILTNTFGGNRFILKRHNLDDQVAEINRAAAQISRNAAGNRAKVFASIGPSGVMLMMGQATEDELKGAFAEQAVALAEGGADAIVVETMADPAEAALAVAAAAETGLPVIGCMTFDSGADKDRTMMGTTPEQAVEALAAAGAQVIGSNCGQGIAGFVNICRRLRAATDLPVWIKANAGLPEMVDGQTVYKQTPGEFAGFVPQLIEAGANFIGGCCGTTPEFIRAVKENLSS